MFYLYVKTHNTTGLKYLGQTKNDPFNYRGSGTHWMRHIKKHGYDVTTTILYETPYREEIKELGLYFSDLWNIVESKEFANLVVECGDGSIHSEETKNKISKAQTGKKNNFYGKSHSEETKRKMSEAHKGKTISEETKRKIGKAVRGVPKTEEHKRKVGEAHKGKILSEEQKRMISKVHKGKILSEETKRKMSKPKRKSICPHCDKIGTVGIMKSRHFDNCKEK